MGAAQALSNYIGEIPALAVDTLTVTKASGLVTVTAPDGSRVEISTTADCNIKFISADGTVSKTITSITEQNGVTTVTGDLKANTGVFGGGERFDTVNQRGKTVSLYTEDGWNDDATTYIAIPQFVTSDGCGIFMNRYEPMSFVFGNASDNTWTATLQNDTLDLYVNVTGKMSDALLGYSDLTGHASLPAEWAQGVLICRYGPDFSSYETDTPTANKDGAPSGYSVKTIVTKLIDAGMKPDAVILENWSWGDISNDSNNANANEATLKATVEWLHSKEVNVKTMLYLRVGNIESSMKGYKQEYLLSANMYKWESGSSTLEKTVTDIPRTSQDGKNPDASTATTFRYLDITNPEAMNWYLDMVWGQLIDLGVDGVKIDFCEDLPETGTHFNFNIKKGNPATQYLLGDYTVTYNWKNPGYFASGTEHHAYPTYFISAFYERMNELADDGVIGDDFVVLSRGGGIGSQRNPFMWAGDQVRAFENLENQVISLLSTGLSGLPFMTYDMAGYRYYEDKTKGEGFNYADTEENRKLESRIFARAVEYTAFTATIQTHGTVRNAYDMTPEVQAIYKNYVALHDELMPYIRKVSLEACETGMPIVRHLVLFAPEDTKVYNITDEFMLGDAILVAPILTDNTTDRSVYLPEGNWLNMLTGQTVTGGQSVNVTANIGQIPVFLNTASADYESVKSVFEGATWTAIKTFTPAE